LTFNDYVAEYFLTISDATNAVLGNVQSTVGILIFEKLFVSCQEFKFPGTCSSLDMLLTSAPTEKIGKWMLCQYRFEE